MADTPKLADNYRPTGKEEEVRKMVYQRKTDMENGSDYQEASRDWEKWRKQWNGRRLPKDRNVWQSNHIVPITFAAVETVLAEISDETPEPIIMARGAEDEPKAMVMSHIFQYSWEVADGDSALYDLQKDAFITGTSIGQEYYLKQERKVKRLDMVNGKEKESEVTITEFDDPMLESVRLEEFRIDENARAFTGPYAARDCVRRYIMNEDDFRSQFNGPIWNPLGNAEKVRPGGNVNYFENYHPPQGINLDKQLEVLWYWSRIPEDWLIIVANDVVVKMGPNPYKHKQLPFVRMVDVKRPHCFYGKGEPEILESVQDEKNLIRRMLIDRNHLDIDKMFAVSNRENLNEEDLMARPHGMIPVDDPKSIQAIEYGDIPRSVEWGLKALDEDGVTATGVDVRLSAMPQATTATQAAIIKETALKRIRLKVRLMERDTLIPLARMRVANIMQFYSQPKMELIVGDEETADYKSDINRLETQGLLVQNGGQNYRKQYRSIRLQDKSIDYNNDGNPVETPMKGYSFFTATPDTFMPVARGGYDIKFGAGATLPISKPLDQTRKQELYDRLIQNPAFDPQKLGDMVIESNDLDPDDLHAQQQPADQQQEQDTQQSQDIINLAMQENKMMVQGQDVPATPNAPPAHTRIHIEFIKSDQVPSDQNILQIFTTHVSGEIMAQQHRQGMGAPGQMPGMPGAAPMGNASNSPQTAVQQGESLRGAISPAKSKRPMQNVMPALVTGSRTMPTQA